MSPYQASPRSPRVAAALGRPRRWLLALWLAAPLQAAQAALGDQLVHCRAIGAAAERLACYDALVPSSAAAAAPALAGPTDRPVPATPPTAVPAAVQPAAANAAPVATSAAQNFGAETVVKKVEEGPADLKARLLDRIDGLPRGAVFNLDNGQVWQSIDDREYEFEADRPAVTITRNFMGNYWLRLEKAGFNVRVSRIR
jgi:hypothetical protein